jgi:hypothetical protein
MTKVAKLQMKLDKQVVALATQAKSVISPSSKYQHKWWEMLWQKEWAIHFCRIALNKEGRHSYFQWRNVSLVH